MLRLFLVLLLSIGVCNTCISQSPAKNTNESVQAVVINIFNALSNLDTAALRSYCTSDVMVLESGQVWNFDSLAIRITTRKARSVDFKRVNRFEFIETRILDNAAYVSYFNYAAISIGGKTSNVKWIETAVMRKEKKVWKMALLHSTELERK